jgi:hypothetical protein
MSYLAFTLARPRASNHFDVRVRLQAQLDQLDREISLLREELRINNARTERVPAQRRPHYPPIERLAILELRAARGWSQAETARRLLVTPLNHVWHLDLTVVPTIGGFWISWLPFAIPQRWPFCCWVAEHRVRRLYSARDPRGTAMLQRTSLKSAPDRPARAASCVRTTSRTTA